MSDRAAYLHFDNLMGEVKRRQERKRQSAPGGLMAFIRHFWHVLEPETPLVEGWTMVAICEHLEAVTRGDIRRLLINVPPGFCKSLIVDVFWPAWEWGPMGLAHLRYVTFSYTASLTERDNERFRDLIVSQAYRELWPNVSPIKTGATKVTNTKKGWKLASSVGGVGTGERGDRVILDDPNNVKEAESETVRDETNRWFRESMSNRLNSLETGVIVIIMQRVHEEDVSGLILSLNLDYEHLVIPMEFDWARVTDESGQPYQTVIGWVDPRWVPLAAECDGELAWPERFPQSVIDQTKHEVGPFAFAGQYQQTPEPRGGGIFKREFWQLWQPPDGKFPEFEYIVASLDSAFTKNTQNDPSALTVWGVFLNERGQRRIMLILAWRKFLEMHGPKVEKKPDEHVSIYRQRAMQHWGLVEWVADSCRVRKVDRLLIEGKASGISAAQELMRLHGREGWAIQLCPVKGDKEARALAVQPTFSQGMVYAPVFDWAEMVKDEMAVFPKGKFDDCCFVAGTLIATERGNIPIEQIQVGIKVFTPLGLMPVSASGWTGNRPVIEKFGLTATPHHPIFTLDKGYRSIDSDIQASQIVGLRLCDLIKTTHQMKLNSTVLPIGEWVDGENTISRNPRIAKAQRDFMSLFGSSILGKKYQRVMRSTMSILTHLISAVTIWSAYRQACIAQCLRKMALNAREKYWSLSDHLRLHGIVLPPGWRGIESTPLRVSTSLELTTIQSLERGAAFGAGPNLWPAISDESFARQYANFENPPLDEGFANDHTRIMPVYNLTVDGAQCYYANGVLVHNCDSATQAIKHLRDIGLAQTDEEVVADDMDRVRHRPRMKPLYPTA